MGASGGRCAEDDLCAELLKNSLENKSTDLRQIKQILRKSAAAQKFFNPNQLEFPEQDFYYCMELNRCCFSMRVERKKEELEIRKYVVDMSV